MERKENFCQRIFINGTRPLMDGASHGFKGQYFSLDEFYAMKHFGDTKNGLDVVLHGIPNLKITSSIADVRIDTDNEKIVILTYNSDSKKLEEMLTYDVRLDAVIGIWTDFVPNYRTVIHIADYRYASTRHNSIPSIDEYDLPPFPTILTLNSTNKIFVQLNETLLPSKLIARWDERHIKKLCRQWQRKTGGRGVQQGDLIWNFNKLYRVDVIASALSKPLDGEGNNKYDTVAKLTNLVQTDTNNEDYLLLSADNLIFNHSTILCPQNVLVVYENHLMVFYHGELRSQYCVTRGYPENIRFLIHKIFVKLKIDPVDAYDITDDGLDICTELLLHEYMDKLPIGKDFINDVIVIYSHDEGFAYNYVTAMDRIIEKAQSNGIPVIITDENDGGTF